MGRKKPLSEVRRGLSQKILTTMWDRAGRSQYEEFQHPLTFKELNKALNPMGTRANTYSLWALLLRHIKYRNVLRVVINKDHKRNNRNGYVLSKARLHYMYRNRIV